MFRQTTQLGHLERQRERQREGERKMTKSKRTPNVLEKLTKGKVGQKLSR